MADEEKIILSLEAEDGASQKIDNVTRSIRNLEKESGTIGLGSANGVSRLVSSIEDGIRKVNVATRNYNIAMQGINRIVTNGIKDMGSAIYDFTSDAINNFTDFSEQHAKTLGAMAADYDNTTTSQEKFFENAQKLKEQAMQLGTYGVTGNGALMNVPEVSAAQTELIKAGISSDDIVNSNVTSDVLEFAQANDLGTSEAVEFAVTLGNQFGIDESEWGSMLDKVSHTADMSVIDVADIVQSMKWASGISSGLGRDLEETLGLISVLGDFGLKGSQAGTGIQALLTRLLTGDTTVITQAQAEVAPGNALEKFYEFEKVAKPDGNLLPMADIIDELNATMEDMTDEEQAWFAKKLFGLYQMKSAYALLNGDEADLNDIIKEIKEQSEGTNENKLNLLLESQYGQLTSLNNLWEGIKTDVGDRSSPLVNAIRDELFEFLSNDGNYDINFDNLQSALDESSDLIEERYGSAIANAVRNLGDVTIDLTQIASVIGPEFGKGILQMLNSLLVDGDIFGDGGVFDDWGSMIGDMYQSVDGLPEELQDLGSAVVSTIDWFGKLMTLNVASQIAELISSILQILTIAGGAIINVAGSVVVTGGAGTGGTGGKGAGGAGAGSTWGSAMKGSTKLGTADDVASALGTTTDDVVSMFGKKASYTIDDIAKGFGTTSDDIIGAFGSSLDDIAKIGLWDKLSGFGKGLGVFGTALQVGTSGYEAYKDYSSGDIKGGTEAIGGGAGSLTGGWAGAKAGAAIGTAINPGLGTGIGAIIGAIGGALGGDWLGRELSGGIYDAFTADSNPKNPSYYGLPENLNAYSGREIPWETITDELLMARDDPSTYGSYEDDYKMTYQEAKYWESSTAYQEYIAALNGAKEALLATQDELNAKMIEIKKGDDTYNSNLDVSNAGKYSVWTGTQEELDKYLSSRTLGDTPVSSKGTPVNPYTLNDMSESIKNAIISGLSESKGKDKSKGKDTNTNSISADNVTVNANSTNMTGEVTIPNIRETLLNGRLVMPSDSKKAIENIINNQIQIDDTVTMKPSFSVAAPNVNVNVKVDKDEKIIKETTILPPTTYGSLLDNWYQRTSSRYGKTTK